MSRVKPLLQVLEGRSVASSAHTGEDEGRGGGGATASPDASHRRYGRVDTRMRCWCEGENVTYYARMKNFGEGGVFVRTSTPLSVGAHATVRFASPRGSEVQVRAHVVWKRTDGMGLRFDDLDAGALELIRGMVDNR